MGRTRSQVFFLPHIFRSCEDKGINNEFGDIAKFTEDTDVLRIIKSKTSWIEK